MLFRENLRTHNCNSALCMMTRRELHRQTTCSCHPYWLLFFHERRSRQRYQPFDQGLLPTTKHMKLLPDCVLLSVYSQSTPIACMLCLRLTRSRSIGGAYSDRHGETNRCCNNPQWSRLAANVVSADSDSAGYDNHAKVLVVGGSGRVGGSTVRALRQLAGPNLQLTVGGRSERNFVKSVEVHTYIQKYIT